MRKRLLSLLTFVVPFLMALFFSGGSPGWLDASEFVASSASLGLSHPPGHPAYLFMSHLFLAIPFGSVAFRLAVFSSFCLGLASWLTYRILLHLAVATRKDIDLPWHSLLISFGVTLSTTFTYTSFLQAVRPEVYTLHAALILACLERLLTAFNQCKGWSNRDLSLESPNQAHLNLAASVAKEEAEIDPIQTKPLPQRKRFWQMELWQRGGRDLSVAAWWGGIALCNHHYLTLLMVPGCLVLMGAMGYKRLTRSWMLVAMTMLVAWGLVTYTYLPIRSMAKPTVQWGEAHSVKGVWWYVSAKAWQKSIRAKGQKQNMGLRAFLLSSIFVEQLGWIWFLLGILGMYFFVRTLGLVGVGFVLWWGFGVLGRFVMVVDRFDADLHGYLVVPMLLFGGFVAILLAELWQVLHELFRTWMLRISEDGKFLRWSLIVPSMAVGMLLILPSLRFPETLAHPSKNPFSLARCNKSQNWSPLLWIELVEEPLPLNAHVFTSNYQTGFLRWYRKVVELHRPDVKMFPRNLLGWSGYRNMVVSRDPSYKDLYQSFGSKKPGDKVLAMRALAKKKPVCIEWFDDLPTMLSASLYPAGTLFCWLPSSQRPSYDDDGQSSDDVAIKEQQGYFWKRVYKHLNPYKDIDPNIKQVLLYTHYQHARFYRFSGRWESGLQEVILASKLAKQSPALKELEDFFREQLSND